MADDDDSKPRQPILDYGTDTAETSLSRELVGGIICGSLGLGAVLFDFVVYPRDSLLAATNTAQFLFAAGATWYLARAFWRPTMHRIELFTWLLIVGVILACIYCMFLRVRLWR